MISGVTFVPSLETLIAASITALVCILAISGYVTAKRQPLCPIIGLNSFKESILFFKVSKLIPKLSAKGLISSSVWGKNSCNGGSK